jgi:hypothetical protein
MERKHSWLALWAAIAISVTAQAPRLAPNPDLASIGALGPSLGASEFARAALLASGATGARAEALARELEGHAEALIGSLARESDPKRRGEAALGYLYDAILIRYSEYQTLVDRALEQGDYNCVSSAVLYLYLAKSLGLDATGVETPDHAFCSVFIQGGRVDVETTNPYGFEPGVKKALESSDPRIKRYTVVPASSYRNRKDVDDRRMVALILNNRIATLERAGRFAEAVGLAVDAHALQGGGPAGKELAERFMNYAGALANGKRELEALAFIEAARDAWGPYPRYQEVFTAAAGNLAARAMAAMDFAAAEEVLARWGDEMEGGQFASIRAALRYNQLGAIAETASLDEFLPLLRAAHAEGSLSPKDYASLAVYAYSKEADRFARAGDWPRAAAIAQAGAESLAGNAELLRMASTYRANHAIALHNDFAALWNAGDFAAARRVVEEGLALYPGDARLKSDLAALQRIGK